MTARRFEIFILSLTILTEMLGAHAGRKNKNERAIFFIGFFLKNLSHTSKIHGFSLECIYHDCQLLHFSMKFKLAAMSTYY